MQSRWLLLALASLGFFTQWATADAPPYKNPATAVEDRVNDLLGRMTLDEKVQQLRCVEGIGAKVTTKDKYDAAKAAKLLTDGLGEVAPMDDEVNKEVALRNSIQKYLVEQTRLGIPAIFHDEACHGFRDKGATSFPAPIGLACSWDAPLVEKIYSVVAGEMRARGVSHALAPVVDIDRDPRWGRTDETMGEDPVLNGTLGAAVVRGLQGSADGSITPGHVAATLKHFAGHGQSEGGINRSPGDIPPREMYDAHLVPFRIAIAQGHPACIMPSYNEVDGVPSHINSWLLQTVLRAEFKWDGLVVSDYSGVEYLVSAHAVAANDAAAALRAFTAGVEVNLPDGHAFSSLEKWVNEGKIPTAMIDAAVRHVLRLKFAIGLFESPYGDAKAATDLANLDSSKTLARQAAAESIVLLKNRDHFLPLARDKYKTIAVIGPNANQDRLGSYSGEPLYKVSILDALQKKLGDNAKVLYAQGCAITTNLPDSSLEAWRGSVVPAFPTESQNQASIAEATTVARQADLIILVLGENEMISREAWSTNHLGDRQSLELIGAQNELAAAMFALGKPVVVYLMNGRPLAMPAIVDKADAVLEGWYMGQETGNAAADILYGDINPSGKLTISIPRATGQVPVYYDYKPGARLYNYVDGSNQPLFPFGAGLSYTTFTYAAPTVSVPTITADGSATVSTTVTNTGAIAGDEIVQFYIHEKNTSVTRPVKELKGFQRITLAPGESRKVEFTVDRGILAFHGMDMKLGVEPCDVDLMIGSSSAQTGKVALRVTE